MKNKILLGAFIAAFAIFGLFMTNTIEAMTAGASSSFTVSGCANGAKYSTTTGSPCTSASMSTNSDTTMNPPALGVLPVGCDLGVGTVYSPVTGESCSVNGVAITPPIAMFPPYDANGCKPGANYSITIQGFKCSGGTGAGAADSASMNGCATGPYNTITGAKCYGTGLIPTPKEIYDQIPVAPLSLTKVTASSSVGEVKSLQILLNGAFVGNAPLSLSVAVDGKYGAKTRDAIRKFQIQAGLKADGVAGPMTLQALIMGQRTL